MFCFHVVKRGRLFLIRGRYVSNFSYPFVYVMGVNAVVLEVGCRAFIVKAGRKCEVGVWLLMCIYSPIQEQCLCKCGGRGCQSRRSWTEPRRRSPDPGWRGRHVDRYSGPGGRSPSPYNRSASPGRQSPRPSRGIYDDSARRRGVWFLSPSREDPVRQQGNEV